jgi:hypothetical protein
MNASATSRICGVDFGTGRGVRLPTWWRHTAALVVAAVALAMLGGCVTLVSSYDQESVDRTAQISKSVLTLYQQLLSTPPEDRRAAVNGPLAQSIGDIETQMRLHLLREQARDMNSEGATVAENLLKSWLEFSASHRSEDETALSDATLNIERGILERHLRAAFVAEESKKLARKRAGDSGA